MATNFDVAHSFFYQENERFDKNYMNVSYNDDTFYSYYTAIGRKIKTRDNKNILLVADNYFSSTTCKHISNLISACPYDYIRVPQKYGNHYMELSKIIEYIKENLEYYSKEKMTRKENRTAFSKHYEMLIELNKKVIDIDNDLLEKYNELYNTINNPEKLKLERQKQKQIEKEQKAKLKFELNNLLTTRHYSDLVKFAYSDFWFNDTSIEDYNKQKELKAKLRKYLNPKNEYSFCWFNDDKVITSQCVRVDRKEAETLLKLWQHKKLKIGMKISYYTVLSIKDKFVKIGCHTIPTENFEALLEVMNTEKEVA